MSMQKNSSGFEEQFRAFLQEAIEKVQSEEDPIVLNDFKKLFKKTVPFARRSYVAAFLAKEMLSRGFQLSRGSRRTNNRTSRFEKQSRTDRTEKAESFSKSRAEKTSTPRPEREASFTRVTIDEDKATTIFIGMGRNRGVYARDVIGLITQRAGIDRERIGEIKILDNYSFVQVYIEDADTIISLTNGTDYRNRKLAVSFAHKKENDAATETDTPVESVEATESTEA